MNVLAINQLLAAPWGWPLLEGINLQLGEGEIVGIIGPNGAGKSSLLAAISGEFNIAQGEINLFDRALTGWCNTERAQIMAMLPQRSQLNFPYTVAEVILLGRIPHNTGVKQDQKILLEVMAATDTFELYDRIYLQLSGGEKQRVQLARVFAQIWPTAGQPRLLLLDEPSSALDLAHQQLILRSLRALAQTGCSILLVSHDFNLISALSDRVCALAKGKIHSSGRPHQVMTKEVFKAVFNVDVAIGTHPISGRPQGFSLCCD